MEFPWRCNVDTIAMDLKVSWEMSDQLGSGDKLRINFRGEHYSDLSGDYEIVGDGIAALPLVGNIYLGGKTVSEAAKTIKSAYKPGYIKDPEINVQVLNYRPFYIWGQVDSPGKYPLIISRPNWESPSDVPVLLQANIAQPSARDPVVGMMKRHSRPRSSAWPASMADMAIGGSLPCSGPKVGT